MTEQSQKRPASAYDVKFYVTWSQDRRAFGIKRDGVPTGTFSRDKNAAIGLAIAEAARIRASGQTACVYSYNEDGNRSVEWDTLGQ